VAEPTVFRKEKTSARSFAETAGQGASDRSLRQHFRVHWVLFCAASLAIWVGFGAQLYLEHRVIGERESERLRLVARVIDEQIGAMLDIAGEFLVETAREFGRLEPSLWPEMKGQLYHLNTIFPGVRSLSVRDRSGRIVLSNQPASAFSAASLAAKPALPPPGPAGPLLSISKPFRTTDGVFAIELAVAVADPGGEVAGSVTATVYPEFFSVLPPAVIYAPDMWAAIAHEEGTLFVMAPSHLQGLGANLAKPGTLFTRHRESGVDENLMKGIVFATGENCIVALHSVRPSRIQSDRSLVVAASRSVEGLYAGWRRHLVVLGCFVGLATLLFAFGLRVYQKRVNRLALRMADTDRRVNILMKSSLDGIAVVDQSHRVIEANHRFAEMLGYTEEEVLQLHTWDYEAEMSEEQIRADFSDLTTTEAVFETRHRRKDGSFYDAEVCASGALIAGRPMVLTITRDISGRKSAERMLEQSEEKFRRVFENDPDPVVVSRLRDGVIVDVNLGFSGTTGYAREEVLGRTALEMNFWADSEDRAGLIGALREKGVVRNLETAFLRKDGKKTRTLVSASIFPLQGEEHVYFSARPIEDLKKAEEKIRVSERRNREILQTAMDGFVRLDGQGNFMEVNQAYCSMTGYGKEEFAGKNMADLTTDLSRDQIAARMALIAEKGMLRFESHQRRKDGRMLDVEVSAHFLQESGQGGFVAFVRDISERKAAEEEKARTETLMLQLQRMEAVGTLAAGIAHDFNNILMPILGISEILLEDMAPGSQEYRDIQQIFTAAQRASGLVRQILAFSRQTEQEKVPVYFQHILKEVFKLARSTIPANIAIEEDIDTSCGKVLADPTSLHQIALNLITNAFHAVEESAGIISLGLCEVSVGSREGKEMGLAKGRYVRFSVADNGPGIDPAIRKKIFEPYFTTKALGKGTGLGLALVYGIAKEAGGQVRLQSELGRGTTVQVYLPLLADQSSSAPGFFGTQKPGQKAHGRLLLVDDELQILQMQKSAFRKAGYKVNTCTSGMEGLQTFKADPDYYDLVITDMAMPGMTGTEMAQEMMAIRPDLPIILCTGFSEKIDEEAARDLGFRGFVMKPVLNRELMGLVESILLNAP
jgi:PAS domain S-box-containing protein